MKRFCALYRALDETTKTNEKLAAMVDYFGTATPSDAAWAVYFLSGNKLRRLIPSKILRQWAADSAEIPLWLFEETYGWVGDLAETLSLVVPTTAGETSGTLAEWVATLSELRDLEPIEQTTRLSQLWQTVAPEHRFVLMKMITGSMRVGVSQRLVTRALAKHADIPADVLSHRLMGDWQPTPEFYGSLFRADTSDADDSRPYPFCLANPLENAPQSLGDASEFLVEWKWDGIRAQVIRRNGQTYLWSRGEERLDGKYPEVESAAEQLQTDCVLDGELLGWRDGQPLPFGEMQRRIGRKKVGKKLLADVPVVFQAFDILEFDGKDIRSDTTRQRRSMLTRVVDEMRIESSSSGTASAGTASAGNASAGNASAANASLQLSKAVEGNSWDALTEVRKTSRENRAEGLMLKHLDSPYQVGRVRGHWWKWKIEPFSIDAVLIYAQRGHGRRASLYSDYTFALWDDEVLVPFAKAYSGLTDAEIRKVDAFVRKNTQDKFGPVRSVKPELVMELAFENIQISTRHKCGLAVRFPRIVRWRHDKKSDEVSQLSELQALLELQNNLA